MAEGQSSSKFEDSCVICKLGFQNEKATTVAEKGMISLIRCKYQQDTHCKSFSTQKLPSRFH